MPETPVDIVDVFDDRVSAFLRSGEREALSSFYGFKVIRQEQPQQLAAMANGVIIGALASRIGASLTHIDALAVAPRNRRHGVGSALLERLREISIYYNCHKITVEVPAKSDAQRFFESNGYKLEAILPQHTYKLDVAVMRKFLL